jgi:hypothetical protein
MFLMRSEDYFTRQLVKPLTKLSEYFKLRRYVLFEVLEQGAEIVQTPVFRDRRKRISN